MVKQIEIFKKQLEFANERNKLVTIHCVYEWEKLFKAFESMNLNNLKNNKIILHSFQGSKKIMEKFNKYNVYFSISPGCYNDKNFEMLKGIPLDRILLESDSPSMFNKEIYEKEADYDFYFSELSEEGSDKKIRNHSMCIKDLLKKMSILRNIDDNELYKSLLVNNEIILKNILG